jgi:hypothetical protein
MLGKSGNLLRHLKTHAYLKSWCHAYIIWTKRTSPAAYFDENTLLLVKYFISSNTSHIHLQNSFLIQLITKIKIPHPQTFQATILPSVFSMMNDAIGKMLQNARALCFTSDIWSTKRPLRSFLSMTAFMLNSQFERKTVVIGMTEMPVKHNAENIKKATEEVWNKFTLRVSKVAGVVSDEGSPYVRLFKQLPLNNGSSGEDEDEDDGSGLMCFEEQIENDLVNYDFADNFNPE